MKIFKWLGSAGRVSATALLGAGGVAVVGVLGTAAYLLNGPDNNTSFSDLGYSNPDQVVFTSGSNVGYEKGDGSNPFISSRDVNITAKEEADRLRGEQFAAQQREMQQYAAYGTSKGDGLVGNPTYEGGEEIDPNLRNLTGMMDNIQNLASAVGGQAGADGNPGAPGGSEASGDSSFARAATNWNKGVNSSGGVNPHSAGGQGIQNEWAGSAGGSAGGAAGAVGDVLASAQQQVKQMSEGTRLGSSTRFSSTRSQFNRDKDSFGALTSTERKKAEDRLTFAQKRSADEAKNKNRMANTTAFLDGNRVTGGMTFVDANGQFTTGGTQGTQDLNSNFKKGLSRAGEYLDTVQVKTRDREHDGNILKKAMWICFGIALAMSILIPLLKSVPLFGVALSFVALCVGLAAVAVLGGYIVHFLQQGWSYRGIPITATVFAGTMTLGLVLSFVLGGGSVTVKQGAAKAFGEALGLSVGQGAAIGGASAAAGAASAVIGSNSEGSQFGHTRDGKNKPSSAEY